MELADSVPSASPIVGNVFGMIPKSMHASLLQILCPHVLLVLSGSIDVICQSGSDIVSSGSVLLAGFAPCLPLHIFSKWWSLLQ